jgi:hypothetical protein
MKGLALAVMTVMIAACGKSSNSQSNAVGQPTEKTTEKPELVYATAEITPDNYVDIAGQALKTLILNDISSVSLAQAGLNATQGSVKALTGVPTQMSAADVKVKVQEINYACVNGGKMYGQVYDDPAEILKNHRIVNSKWSFSDCNELNTQDGVGLNGDVSLWIDYNFSNIFNNSTYSLGVSLTSDAFSLTPPGYAQFKLAGKFDFDLKNVLQTQTLDLKSEGSTFYADKPYVQILSDITRTVENKSGAYVYDMSVAFHANDPKSVVVYKTTQSLKGVGFNPPTSGALEVIGNSSTIFIKVLANQALELGLDTDQDGKIDRKEISNWYDLVTRDLNKVK